MGSVNLSDGGEDTLEDLRDTFDIRPSKRKAVEKALNIYLEKRTKQKNNKAPNTNNNV